MKVLIFGGGGMLGHKLVQRLNGKFEVWATIRDNFENYEKFRMFDQNRLLENVEVEDETSIGNAIERVEPQVIVNAVGVIKQLPTSKNAVKTITVNALFPHRLAQFAQQFGCRLINIGTDCVFDGKRGNYTETDKPDADDLYGRSKQLGETDGANCLTLRTSIIGRELKTAHSLVEWFLNNRNRTVKGYKNAIFSGFPTVIFADILANLIEHHPTLDGLYHVSSEPINKFDLLNLLNKHYQAAVSIEAFEDYEIDRSLDSTKFREAIGFKPSNWNDMIEIMAEDNEPYRS